MQSEFVVYGLRASFNGDEFEEFLNLQ